MNDETRRMPASGNQPPPSFTPQNTPGGRPRSTQDAVPVGGEHSPVSHVPSRPTTRRPSGEQRPPASVPPARPGAPASRPQTARPARVTSSPHAAARPARAASAPSGTGVPGGPGGRGDASGPGSDGRKPRLRLRKGRIVAAALVLLLVLVVAWPVGLLMWANSKIEHVAALSGAAGTPGTTYLLAGSDSREDGAIASDGTEGARTDTIMLLHVPESGPTALVSLPRDTYTEIPGKGPAKLNAAYAWGGPELLVASVEGLTGITVDHYVEVGLGGVKELVDAVGGVELCLDYDVDDEKSNLKWKAGCHTVKGKKALAFIRMRYSDPKGDIGRAERQRQLISAVTKKAADAGTLVNPGKQVALIDSGLGAVAASEGTGIVNLGQLALAFRAASGGEGITGTPPIESLDYRPGGVGSTVLLAPDGAPEFFAGIRNGTLEPGRYDADGLVKEKPTSDKKTDKK